MFFFLHFFLFLLLHRHTTGCAGTGSCGTIISTTVGMCAARRQRDVAVHMMTSPRLGVSLFRREQKKKRRQRGVALHMINAPRLGNVCFPFFFFPAETMHIFLELGVLF